MTLQLHQGEAIATLRTLTPNSIDALITDPPYSSGGLFASTRQQATNKKYVDEKAGFGSNHLNFEGDNRDQRSWTYWTTLWLTECYRLLKTGSPACVFTDWRQLPALSDAFQAAGFIWRGVYVWDKKNARPNNGRFRQTAEFVVWGSKGELPADKLNPKYLSGMTSQSIVMKNKRHHQTQKPTELMQDLIAIAKPDAIVLDPFMGSGSTGEATLKSGRQFIGIEMNELYFKIAQERLSK